MPFRSRYLSLIYGDEHPRTASTLNNLATIYRYKGNYSAALEAYKKALEITEASLGSDHPSVIAIRKNLDETEKDDK